MSAISGKIFSTIKSENKRKESCSHSRVTNSSLYFSQKLTPNVDVSKRREFFRGLNDYISNKIIKNKRKISSESGTPSFSPLKNPQISLSLEVRNAHNPSEK